MNNNEKASVKVGMEGGNKEGIKEGVKEDMKNRMSSEFATRWILLRGLGRDSRHWGDTVAVLEKHFPYHEFYTLDLPGTGIESESAAPINIAANVDFLRSKYGTLLAGGPVNLLAISLGGMVAANWMARFPQDISRAVLINSSSRLNPFYHRFNPAATWQLICALCKAKIQGHALTLEQCIAGWVVNNSGQEAIANQWASFYSAGHLGVTTLLRQLFAAARFVPLPVRHSLLLINSLEDRLVNPDCSQRLAAFWQQPLVSHPQAGHDLPIDDPKWLASEIGRWLLREGGTVT